MGPFAERKLVGQAALPDGGRVIVEMDERGTCVAWGTSEGGRAEAYFGRLLGEQVEKVLAVFREEGAELPSREPASVRERLAIALDPEGALRSLLGSP